jgi:hypothetical protein
MESLSKNEHVFFFMFSESNLLLIGTTKIDV